MMSGDDVEREALWRTSDGRVDIAYSYGFASRTIRRMPREASLDHRRAGLFAAISRPM